MDRNQTTAPPPPPVKRRIPDPSVGLSAEEVESRAYEGLSNVPVAPASKSIPKIFLSNLFTYFNLLFYALAICLLLAGSSLQNLLFLVVVFSNTAIGIIQELRAERVLRSLTLLSAPRATVVRDGSSFEIPADELVLDDIVIFSAGNQIPADALVLAGEVQVNESLITGESNEITKKPDSTLLSGSYIVSGRCWATLTAVGADSFVSKLTLEAKKHKKVAPPGMMRSLSVLVRIIGVLILPLGGVLYWQQITQRGKDTLTAVESSVTNVLGMIPEGLYLLASAALALAVIRLARRKILAHDLSCVETLARVDTLCLDKTGTITEDKMNLAGILPAGGTLDETRVYARLAEFAAASEADNATILALKEALTAPNARAAQARVPFSSRYKFSAVSFGPGEHYLLGAPEILLGERFQNFAEQLDPYLAKGMRVLAFATCDEIADSMPRGSISPLCFVLLENRIRKNAPETFRYFADQGVTIKVISGDNPQSVSQIALQAGIAGADRYIDATSLTTERQLFEAAQTYTVFGRVTPEQKRSLVRALKKAGHTVAMTGDGVNDVLALKEASCSIAMASGSDVACSVSQLVLLNSDFSAMPSVVAEGRQVINNIERSASLFLVKNIFAFCVAILLLLAPLSYPVKPVQLSLLSTLTIGIPSFFLALEPNKNRVRGKFLRNILSRALPAGLTDFTLLAGVMLFAYAFPDLPEAQASAVATLLLCLVGFLMLYTVARPLNLWRGLLLSLLLAAFFVLVLFFPSVFLLEPLTLAGWLMLVLFALLSVPLLMLYTYLQKKIGALFARLGERLPRRR